jgi:hypothetical protein
MMMMMMMIFAHLSSLPNALVSAQRRHRKSSATRARKGRTHRRFLAFLLRKRFLSTEKKRKERERDVRPTFENLCKSEFWLKFNWPKLTFFCSKFRSIFGLFSGGVHDIFNARIIIIHQNNTHTCFLR